MERIIRIDGFNNQEKKDKSGTFPRFECMIDKKTVMVGVFEKDVSDALKKCIGEWVKVVAPERANGYINITHFIAKATKEEIPSYANNVEASGNEPTNEPLKNNCDYNERPVSTSKAEAFKTEQISTRIIHEIIDNRIVYNKYEFGAANDRHTIKYKDIADFKKQYQEIVEARRVIDTDLNPKQ